MICFQRRHFVFESNNDIQVFVFQCTPIAYSHREKAVLTSDMYKSEVVANDNQSPNGGWFGFFFP